MGNPPFKPLDEKKITAFIHDIRVYIAGADVSAYLTGSVAITYADRDGTNTCSFTLSNQGRAFEITEDNVNNNFRVFSDAGKSRELNAGTPAGRYSELVKWIIYQNKQRFNVTHAVKTFGPIKSSNNRGTTLSGASNSRNAGQAQSTVTKRYPFNVGSLVLHKYDPVRVFVRDPFNQLAGEAESGGSDRWVNVFTGYVDLKPYTQDFTDGNSFIKVTCQDIRMLMKNMRTQINPSVQVGVENCISFTDSGGVVKDSPSAGFFNDLIGTGRQLNHVLGGLSWKESVKFLLRGVEYTQPGVEIGQTANRPNRNLGAIGKLTTKGSTNYRYDPKSSKASTILEDWNNLIIFGNRRTYMTTAEMMKIGQETREGGMNTPDVAFIHFLEPASGSPPTNLIEYSFEAPVAGKQEWSSRLELLQSLCRSVDYQFYVTGSGDVIFEFPMYDFLPDDYGSVYNTLYSFEKHVVADNINDEGGTPISGLLVTSRNLFQEVAKGNPESAGTTPVANSQELTRTIYSNVLASRVGPLIETHFVPGITDQDRLTQYGMMEFIKRIAEYDKFSIDVIYRPYLGVNRPIYYKIKRRIGITQSVTYDWAIRGEVQTTMELAFVRKQEINADGTYSFRFITGGESTPMSYSKYFDTKQTNLDGQGVSSAGSSGNKQDPSKPSAQSGSSGSGKI